MSLSYTISLLPSRVKSELKGLALSPRFKNVPVHPSPRNSFFPHGIWKTNGLRGGRAGRGSAGCPRAPELRNTKGIPSHCPPLSITSTSKAVACAVISTAGNVTTRPTAQTTTSARAMVSGRHRTTPRASEAAPPRLRPSCAAEIRRVPLPFPAAPRPPGDPAQRRSAAPGAPREPGGIVGGAGAPGRPGRAFST